jgi:hypothetical protein
MASKVINMPELFSIARSPSYDKWPCLMLAVGEQSTEVGLVGYDADPLGRLVRTALVIATNGRRAEMTLPQGPIERRLIVERVHEGGVQSDKALVMVTDRLFTLISDECSESSTSNLAGGGLPSAPVIGEKLEDGSAPNALLSPHSEEITVLQATVVASQFTVAILQCARAIWDEHGTDDFNKTWSGPCPFPLHDLRALEAALLDVHL